jgi:hypothetical protein
MDESPTSHISILQGLSEIGKSFGVVNLVAANTQHPKVVPSSFVRFISTLRPLVIGTFSSTIYLFTLISLSKVDSKPLMYPMIANTISRKIDMAVISISKAVAFFGTVFSWESSVLVMIRRKSPKFFIACFANRKLSFYQTYSSALVGTIHTLLGRSIIRKHIVTNFTVGNLFRLSHV